MPSLRKSRRSMRRSIRSRSMYGRKSRSVLRSRKMRHSGRKSRSPRRSARKSRSPRRSDRLRARRAFRRSMRRSMKKKYHGLLGSLFDSKEEARLRQLVESKDFEKKLGGAGSDLFLRKVKYLFNLTGDQAKVAETVVDDLIDDNNNPAMVKSILSKIDKNDKDTLDQVGGAANAQRLKKELSTTSRQIKRSAASAAKVASDAASVAGSIAKQAVKLAF